MQHGSIQLALKRQFVADRKVHPRFEWSNLQSALPMLERLSESALLVQLHRQIAVGHPLRAVAQAARDVATPAAVKARQERETSLITRFYYPKYGPGQMWETVADHVRACGGEVRLQTRVVAVKWSDNRVESVTVENVVSGRREEVACEYFFSTMPIKHWAASLTPPPPPQVSAVAENLAYRDFLTVGLLLRKLHVREQGRELAATVPDNWIYIQEGDVRVGRVQVFNNWSPYMLADRANSVWIGLEYFVSEGDDLWECADRQLIELGISEMEQIEFILREDVLDACVLRMPKAYPAYFGSYDQLPVVRNFVETIPNLFLVGRNGMHRYNNQDHSMLTAMLAVDNIVEGRTDKSNLWDVNVDMVYHETQKST